MNTFNVSNFFKTLAQQLKIDDIDFDLMPLTSKLIEEVKECKTYNKMLCLAADSGLSYDNNRVVDDVSKSVAIESLWGNKALDIECEIILQHQVGLFVCEISGITKILTEQAELEKLEAEEAAEKEKVVDEEFIEKNGETSLGQLEEDEAVEKALY